MTVLFRKKLLDTILHLGALVCVVVYIGVQLLKANVQVHKHCESYSPTDSAALEG